MPIRLIFFIMAVLIAFFGVRMLFYGTGEMYDDVRLHFKGKTSTVSNIVRRSDVGDDKVFFRTEDGLESQVTIYVPEDVRAKFNEHDPVTIRYLPREPSVNRLNGQKSGAGAFYLFGLFMIASGVYMMRLFSRRRAT